MAASPLSDSGWVSMVSFADAQGSRSHLNAPAQCIFIGLEANQATANENDIF